MSRVSHLYRSPVHFHASRYRDRRLLCRMQDGLVGESLKGSQARQTFLGAWGLRV
jgi:hypothetical protein